VYDWRKVEDTVSDDTGVRRMELPSQWRDEFNVRSEPEGFARWSRPQLSWSPGVPARFHTVTTAGVINFDNREQSSTAALGCSPFHQETMVSTRDEDAALLTWRRWLGGRDRIEFTILGTLESDGGLRTCLRVLCGIDEAHGGPQLETFRSWDVAVPVESVVDFTVVMTESENPCGYIQGSIGNVG
jgi:hypothetical protein